MAGAQDGEGGLGVAAADGLGQLGDRAGEAVDAAEDDDPVADRDAGRWLGRGHRLPRDLGEAGSARARASAARRRRGRRGRRARRRPRPRRVASGRRRGSAARRGAPPRVGAPSCESDIIDVSSTIDDVVRQLVARDRAGIGWRFRRAGRAAGGASTRFVSSSRARSCSLSSSADASSCTASSSRAAAFPVGAARATSGVGAPAASACSSRRTRMRVTVVVLPVPGPPPTTARRRSTHVAAARRWRSGSSPSNSRARPSASTAGVDVARGLVAGEEVGGDEALVPPVAVEVERRADEPERSLVCGRPRRPRRAGSRRGRRSRPRVPATAAPAGRPASSRSVTAVARDRGEVDADRSEPGCAHGERGREQRASRRLLLRVAQDGARRERRRRPSTPASLKARSVPVARRT